MVQVKFYRRWAWASAAIVALFAIYVRVLVDFWDLFDFVDTGMLATFWEDIGVTDESDIPGFDEVDA